MFKKIAITIPLIALVVAAALGVAPRAVAADCNSPQDCAKQGVDTADTGSSSTNVGDVIKTITNVLLFIVGAVSVIMIVIGGLRYTISNGEASSIKGAKDTIFYAVIGLVVAILGYAIVNWVITMFVNS